MGGDLILMVDYDNICRLCLHSTGAMSDIFATYGKISLQDQILSVTGLTTAKNDGLPSKVCHRCRHIVELSCELRDVVDKSTKLLGKLARGSRDKYSENYDEAIAATTNHVRNKNHGEDNSDEETVIIDEYDAESPTKLLYESQVSDGFEEDEQDYTINNLDYEYNENEATLGSYGSQDVMVDINENTAFGDTDDDRNMIKPDPVRRKLKRPPPELVCQLCLDVFGSKEAVRAHVETHYEGSELENYLNMTQHPLMCTMCDVELSKPQLVVHHRRHLRINPYKCRHPGCTYEGANPDVLRHHSATHGAATRVCEVCGAQFRRPSALQQHVQRVHAAPGEHACAECGFRARNAPALRVHVRAHHSAPTPRFPCPERGCARRLPSARALGEHARAHRGERAHRCPLCDVAAYSSASMLKRHMKLHERARLRKCDKCPATFAEYGAFYRHRVAHHGPFRPRAGARLGARGREERPDGRDMEVDTQADAELQQHTEQPGAVASENVIELNIDDSDCLAQENVLYIEMEHDSETEEHTLV